MIDHFCTRGQDLSSSMTNPGRADTIKPRLLDQVRDTVRRKHYSIRTEQSYIDWIKRYIYFHNKQHPRDLNEGHVTEFPRNFGDILLVHYLESRFFIFEFPTQ